MTRILYHHIPRMTSLSLPLPPPNCETDRPHSANGK